MYILAHRANWEGSNLAQENSLAAVRFCLEQGWGIETDIRRAVDGSFYISHDPGSVTAENRADMFLALFREYPDSTIALNVKELGYETELIRYLSAWDVIPQIFLFDMELLEERPGHTAKLFHSLDSSLKLAARVSDRNEPIERALHIKEAEVIWLDEFDHLWVTEADIIRLKSSGRTIYAISPEIHGFALDEMARRWRQFYAWGIDGICTDYAAKLAQQLATGFQGEYV